MLTVLLVGQTVAAADEGVEYRIEWKQTDNRYHVFMRPTTTPDPDLSLTGQITLRVPHAETASQFVVQDIIAKTDTSWNVGAVVRSPPEDTSVDYLSFIYSPFNFRAFAFEAGVEQEVFSFKNGGACLGSVTLMDNATDPFNQPPAAPSNSAGTNPSNQFANAGWVNENDYVGNYGTPATCVNVSANHAPSVVDDSINVAAGSSTTINVLANDTDADNDTLNITRFTQGQYGKVTQKANALIYTHTGTGTTDSFTYTVSDGQSTATATVNVTIDSTTSGCALTPSNPQANQVYYRIHWDSTDQRYHVYMYPGSVPSPNMSLTSQVTLKVPHATETDSFTASGIKTNVSGAIWTESSRVNAPNEDVSADYLSFNMNLTNANLLDWQSGKELEVFSFANSHACLGDVSLMNNLTDPFNTLPNSAGTNPGNQFTNIGWGSASINNYAGNYGCAATCIDFTKDTDNDGLTDVREAELGTDPKQADTDGDTLNDGQEVSIQTNPLKADVIKLQIKAFLQGTYNSTTQLMSDTLRSKGLIPAAQPYNDATFAYAGTETLNPVLLDQTGNDALVDWVLVELRAMDNPSTVKLRMAGLIQRDGDVVDSSAGSNTLMWAGVEPGNYYVALHHRNHLGVMTAASIALGSNTALVDFTQPTTLTYGKNALTSNKSVPVLWAGNSNQDGRIIVSGPANDVSSVLVGILFTDANTSTSTNYKLEGYQATDTNLDGITIFAGPSNDLDLVLGNVLLHPVNTTFSANYIVNRQVP